MGTVILMCAAALSAVVQRAVGVGYSLVLLPAAVAVLPEGQAVPCVLVVGVLLSGGLLVSGRRRPTTDPTTRGLLTFAPAGQLLALLVLGALAGPALRLAAAGALLAGCAAAVAQGRLRVPEPSRGARVVLGVAIGAIGALTGVIGPFVALVLALRPDVAGDALRRRLWLCTTWLSACALAFAALLDRGDLAGALVGLALAPALVLGALAARPLVGRLEPRQHRMAVLVVAAAGAATLIATQ